MKKFFNEFKEFISKGNVMDMAIGVIIATAFGKITTSLVNDVFMPLIGMLIGGIDLGTLNITLSPAVVDEAGAVVKEAVVVGIGTFLTTVIDFILVAFVVFLVVKAFNSAKAKLEKPAEPEPEPEPEQKSNAGALLLVLALAVVGGGAGWYFKIYRPKQEKAAEPEEDYGEELDDYDDPEDDGPPWDEDDTGEDEE